MVLTAIDDNEASIRIWEDAKALKIPVNVADVPPNCDFYFGSMIRRGPLQVMVSTGGKGPKLAAMLREKLEKALPPETEQAIDKVGKLRAKLRARAPGVGGKLGQERMQWMTGVCEVWSLEDLADLDEPAMDRLLDAGWENRRVPDYQTVLGTGVWWKTLQRQWKEDGVRWFAGGLLSGVLLFALKRRYIDQLNHSFRNYIIYNDTRILMLSMDWSLRTTLINSNFAHAVNRWQARASHSASFDMRGV
ncbi:Siroheme biosynthesis protein met8 Includes: RecName: Full=Precorrin-2 dehydrogenase; Includes: RecName: Full=Sirohydrochlorin ferrochelatase [Serendipita indica DSM 11827]|nr:Siroheme biosynthesis protein met8 Includes: RecName: Full=Precorrin-2 dehydrogenase; Includes: RecName: Full=Sirohydrochlorin ferrochelatase [Serendipita indica DSM 11827]